MRFILASLPASIISFVLTQLFIAWVARSYSKKMGDLFLSQALLWCPVWLAIILGLMHEDAFKSFGAELPFWSQYWLTLHENLRHGLPITVPFVSLFWAVPRLKCDSERAIKVIPWVEAALVLGYTSWTMLAISSTILGVFVGGISGR